MEEQEAKTVRGGGHMFWGIVFVVLGVLALMRRYVVVAGIPVWGAAFMMLGISHLLKAPRVLDRIDPGGGSRPAIRRVATVMYVLAFALLAYSVISTI